MSTFFITFFLLGAGIPILAVSLIYNSASWKWKIKPLKPMMIGLLLMSVAFAAHMYLSYLSTEIKKSLTQHPDAFKPAAAQMLTDSSNAHESLAKLIELVTIPLAVSLIAAALIIKADVEFTREIRNYAKAKNKILVLEDELSVREENFEERVKNGERGIDFLKEWDEIKRLRHHIRFEYKYLYEDHGELLEANAVDEPKK
ncbi:hypothetical protein [Undibacterium sp. Ji49W]|uniref:hypothetical protein n=1 Tax=Undibacterium sp. Ji49W TaxID=3413040 RepID=UPI003BF1DDB6